MLNGLPAGATTPLTILAALLMSSVGLNVWAVRALFTRKLVPVTHHAEVVSTYQEAVKDRDQRIHDLVAERDRAIGLADSTLALNVELVKKKDAALAAVEAVQAATTEAGGSP